MVDSLYGAARVVYSHVVARSLYHIQAKGNGMASPRYVIEYGLQKALKSTSKE